MKKTSKKKGIFSPIINFFDKYLISPITKLILYITDYFKNNNKGIERILNNRQALIIISLVYDTRCRTKSQPRTELSHQRHSQHSYRNQKHSSRSSGTMSRRPSWISRATA